MNYDEAKDSVMSLDRAMVQASIVVRLANRERACAGLVIFDANPPRGTCPYTHFLLFADAIYTALAFVSPQCRDEWLVVGRQALVYVRALPSFTHVEHSYVCPGTALTYIGTIRSISVYVDPDMAHNEWLAGAVLPDIPDEKLCCRGLVQNASCCFKDERVLEHPLDDTDEPAAPEREEILRLAGLIAQPAR